MLYSTLLRTSVDRAYHASRPAPNVSSDAARTLLAEVLARLSHTDLPIVQVMAACRHSRAAGVALGLAVAAVSGYGRTLLVTEDEASGCDLGESRLSGSVAHSVLPDAAVPGLYHRQFDDSLLDERPPVAQSGRPAVKAFRMLVLASPSPIRSPAGLGHATRCHGTILAVAAGLSPLADIQATGRQLQLAGGTVLGTVLYDAPRVRLWR